MPVKQKKLSVCAVYLLLPPVLHLILLCRVVNSKDEEVELHSSVECKVLTQQLFSTSHYVATYGHKWMGRNCRHFCVF